MSLKKVLFIIVLAQFCCTSLWFAGNAIMADLISNFNLTENNIGHLSSAVQFGFITGTLLFAIFNIADRFSPSKIFFICAIIGAAANLLILIPSNTLYSLLSIRFITGFFLAGIYPVGMKIATDYFEKGLGSSLSFLVGALVLGTAFPHILKGNPSFFNWKWVIYITSLLASLGGSLLFFLVPNGPFRKASTGLKPTAIFTIFKNRPFKKAAFGYFGHMWELYAFWTFTPLLFKTYKEMHPSVTYNIASLSFYTIAIGSISCIIAGYLAKKRGTKKIATLTLVASCFCCISSPLFFINTNETLFIFFILCWGSVVIADSPLFSTLVAKNATPEIKGTALTIVNCIGFAITIVSILLVNQLLHSIPTNYIFTLLAIGPVIGLMNLYRK